MSTQLIESGEMLEQVNNQMVDQLSGKRELGYDEQVISLNVSERGLKKIEAAAFYNDYEDIQEYIRDVLFREIELDKERHLKSKESKEVSKLKK